MRRRIWLCQAILVVSLRAVWPQTVQTEYELLESIWPQYVGNGQSPVNIQFPHQNLSYVIPLGWVRLNGSDVVAIDLSNISNFTFQPNNQFFTVPEAFGKLKHLTYWAAADRSYSFQGRSFTCHFVIGFDNVAVSISFLLRPLTASKKMVALEHVDLFSACLEYSGYMLKEFSNLTKLTFLSLSGAQKTSGTMG